VPLSDARILNLLDKNAERLQSIEGWQHDVASELRRIEQDLARIIPIVDHMHEADKVSEALAEAAKTTQRAARDANRVRLSTGQLITAVVVATVGLGGFVLQLVHAVTH
jgi:hypothetical protein